MSYFVHLLLYKNNGGIKTAVNNSNAENHGNNKYPDLADLYFFDTCLHNRTNLCPDGIMIEKLGMRW